METGGEILKSAIGPPPPLFGAKEYLKNRSIKCNNIYPEECIL